MNPIEAIQQIAAEIAVIRATQKSSDDLLVAICERSGIKPGDLPAAEWLKAARNRNIEREIESLADEHVALASRVQALVAEMRKNGRL